MTLLRETLKWNIVLCSRRVLLLMNHLAQHSELLDQQVGTLCLPCSTLPANYDALHPEQREDTRLLRTPDVTHSKQNRDKTKIYYRTNLM